MTPRLALGGKARLVEVPPNPDRSTRLETGKAMNLSDEQQDRVWFTHASLNVDSVIVRCGVPGCSLCRDSATIEEHRHCRAAWDLLARIVSGGTVSFSDVADANALFTNVGRPTVERGCA